MTTKWRCRAVRFLSRRFNPATDAILTELAQRAIRFAREGNSIRCSSCGGTGPVQGVVVLFANPDQRDWDSAAAWCRGCAADAGRRDYVEPNRVALPRDPSPIQIL